MEQFYAIGLMSGTSLDGLDLCYVRFEKSAENKWNFKILHAETTKYNAEWETQLRNSIYLDAEDLCALHSAYGFYLATQVQLFINKNTIERIDVIASHGHTVFHQPHRKFTLQIGDGRAIFLETGIPTVYDFRTQDVLLGGNGAPLVPIGDQYLFSDYDACLNLGGFSNISLQKDNRRIAFDICPVNIVLNHLSQNLGKSFDQDGIIARNGSINQPVLDRLNQLPFYQKNAPKSLGIEWVKAEVIPLIQSLETEEAMATFTMHAAEQIAKILTQYQLNNVLITGGGVYNKFLIELIQQYTATELIIPAKNIIDFKEALIFAFMAVLKKNGVNNILSSATGSIKDHCSGILIQ